MLGKCCVAEQLAASQEELSSMELVSLKVKIMLKKRVVLGYILFC
jgi:hypothetical protein